jgi:hypothetical protein
MANTTADKNRDEAASARTPALLHGLPLVTHNAKHYAGVDGLTVISEATS